MLFATGMNGDEDLGEDITMKGAKFHFVQNPSLAQQEWDAKGLPAIPYPKQDAKQAPQAKDFAKGYDAPEQVHILDPKIGKKATTFYLSQQEYDTKGLPAIPYPEQGAKQEPQAKGWNAGYDAPEQVHVLDPKIGKKATTFYLAQQEYDTKGLPAIPYPAQDAKEGKPDKNWNKGYDAPEQVHVLDPKIGKKATTFYLGQQE